MEIRRVQMTGGSSYIITLPKEWIIKSNVKKNDPIGLMAQSDGTLLLTSKMSKESTQKHKEFKVGNTTNKSFLFRRLIAAYISGYNSIKITSKKRLSPTIRMTVRNYTQTTIGQEIVEETDTSLVIKDLLNPAEMPFNRTIKRMHIMVRGMYEDTIQSLIKKDKQLAEDILNRDNEIDRLHWLVARQHNIILRNVSFAEKMGTTVGMSTTSFLISRIIERIGDHVIKISKNAIDLIDKKIKKDIIDSLEKSAHFSLGIFSKSIGAFMKKDIDEANQIIEEVTNLQKSCKNIDKIALKQNPQASILIGNIVESIRRIGEYGEDIAEHVINHLVGEDNIS